MVQQESGTPTPRGGVRVVVEVGNQYVEPGRTRVEVLPDGRTLVTNRLEEEERRFEGQLEAGRVASLVEQASREAGLQRQADRHRLGLPDEPRYHIKAERGSERILAVDVWRSDLERMSGLARLVQELEGAAAAASQGKAAL